MKRSRILLPPAGCRGFCSLLIPIGEWHDLAETREGWPGKLATVGAGSGAVPRRAVKFVWLAWLAGLCLRAGESRHVHLAARSILVM